MRSSLYYRRLAEAMALFIGLPTLIWLSGSLRYAIILLWLVALPCLWYLWRHPAGRGLWNAAALTRRALKPIVIRWALATALLSLYVLFVEPERWLAFPRERPGMWAMVMLLYPVLSVLPQEVLFRAVLFARYESALTLRGAMTLSVFSFGYAHIALENLIALLLSLLGGWIFADTYARHRSLALVTLEHALYGCTIFTIGLGWYFYHGNVGAGG